jgi:hypothetical protein
MTQNIKDFFTKSTWGTSLLAILALFSALTYSYIEEIVGEKGVLIGGIFSVFTLVVIITISLTISKLEIKKDYQDNNDILKAFIEGHGLGDLISERELSDIESNANSIWVFTRDLSNDIGISSANIQDNAIFETVKKNLEAGKKYTYFIPDDPLKHGAIEEFRKLHTFNDEQVCFCLIPIREFHIVSEIAIYDKNIAVQWFPSKKMNYYIRLDDIHRMGIAGSGKLLLSKYPPK